MTDTDGLHEEEHTLSSDDITQYKAAADITNAALKAVVAACVPGSKIASLCKVGDAVIADGVGKCFKGKGIEKGIAFPTCVSVNDVVGHFSPLEDDTTTIKEGDLVKIDLGTHINGMIASSATTIVCAANPLEFKVSKLFDPQEDGVILLRNGWV